jgi:hypothetical protein
MTFKNYSIGMLLKLILLGVLAISTQSHAAEFHLKVTYPDKEEKQFAVSFDKDGNQWVKLSSKIWSCLLVNKTKEMGDLRENGGKFLNLGCSIDGFKTGMTVAAFCFEDKKTHKSTLQDKNVGFAVIEEAGEKKGTVDKHTFDITCE